MRFPTELPHRHGLAVLLACGVAFYALSYLPARAEYIRTRYFRRAQLQLRQLRKTLTPRECYLLYDLAQDGLFSGRAPY